LENSMLAHNIYLSGSILQDTNTGNFTIGDIPWQQDLLTIDNYYNNYWMPYVYPNTTYVTEKSKIEQAFKILNILMKKEIVAINKVKTFVDIVNNIAEVL